MANAIVKFDFNQDQVRVVVGEDGGALVCGERRSPSTRV